MQVHDQIAWSLPSLTRSFQHDPSTLSSAGSWEWHQVSNHFRKSNSLDLFWVTQGTSGRVKKGLQKICLTGNKEDWDLALPYIAMGYMMSKHASLFHFSPYFLLFGKHPIPPFSIVTQMDQVVDLDSPTTWARVIAERVALFKRVILMAMENLSIAQH